MLFAWLKRRRRRKILETPFPRDWLATLEAIPHVPILAAGRRQEHQNATQIFLAEKTFEGCGGLVLTDAMRVTIAGLATLLVLGMPATQFDHVESILVYPDAFTTPKKVDMGGIALEDEAHLLGEAHYRGPVILSWAEIEEDVREPWVGRNLVFHEFAHQLDMMNGEADGVPELPQAMREPWAKVMAKEYRRLQKRSHRHRDTLLDPYGATEPAEFFAVITETFFDSPLDLEIEHPELYDMLRQYYCLDPAMKMRAAGV